MKYIKDTLEYLFVLEKGKRFIVLFILALPLGTASALILLDWVSVGWILNFGLHKYTFSQVFFMGKGGSSIGSAFIFMLLSYFFIVSIQSSIISRSLRIGVFRVNSLFVEFNDSFFPTLYSFLIYAVMFITFRFFNALFVIMWQTLSSVMASKIMTIISVLAIHAVFFTLFSMTALFMPVMVFEGLKPVNALLLSVQKTSKKLFRILFAVAVPTLIAIAASFLSGFIFDSITITLIVGAVAYSLLSCYLIALTMIIYCDIEHIKRDDYPREYFYKKNRGQE